MRQYCKRNKPGSYSKMTDKHAAECSKAVCWDVTWSVWDVQNCSYNDIAKGILFHDRIVNFVYTGKVHTSKSFWKQHLLNVILPVCALFWPCIHVQVPQTVAQTKTHIPVKPQIAGSLWSVLTDYANRACLYELALTQRSDIGECSN